jgi:hypothetical protein
VGKSLMSTVMTNPVICGIEKTIPTVKDMNSCDEDDLECTSDLTELLDVSDIDLNDMLDCEVFTDFSDLLLDSEGLPYKFQSEEPQQPAVSTIKKSAKKRTATDIVSESVGQEAGADHNYYVPSKKCISETSSVVDDDNPTDVKLTRYLERRRKNNAASKRSRETKKSRMAEMEHQAVRLEQDNEQLRKRIEDLDRLTKLMKTLLVQRVSSTSQ